MDTSDANHRKARVLVLYANPRWTHPVSDALACELAAAGWTVETAEAAPGSRPPPPSDYDAIVIGSPLRFGMLSRAIVDYIDNHIEELEDMPSYLFTVGDQLELAPLIARRTGWVPTRCRAIARPGWRTRWFGDPNAERAPAVHELASCVEQG